MTVIVMPTTTSILTAVQPFFPVMGGLAFVLVLFYGVRQSLRRLRRRVSECETSLQAEAAQLTNAVNDLKIRVEELEADEKQGVNASVAASNGLNNTIRSKALKMHRLGQSTDRISDVLGVPKGEVDLLLKVHRIVMRPYENGAILVEEPVPAEKA